MTKPATILAIGLPATLLCLAACAPAGAGNTDALYVGDCDLVDMRRRAVGIVDNADPEFGAVRSQYRMNFTRRPDTRELVLFHSPREGTPAASQPGGGYVLTFEADSCKFDRLSKSR